MRFGQGGSRHRADGRPIMLAIAGDSGSGKTTLTRALVRALGPERVTVISASDYHRYDREARRGLPFTPLHPACNHLDVMVRHLELLAAGRTVLVPVYNHHDGTLRPSVPVEPREFVVCDGVLTLFSRRARERFDATVYLDTAEPVRFAWKMRRDTRERGWEPEQVKAELARREVESAAFVRPQRDHADVVVRYAPDTVDLPASVTPAFGSAPAWPTAAGSLESFRDAAGRAFDATWTAMEWWLVHRHAALSTTMYFRPAALGAEGATILARHLPEAVRSIRPQDECEGHADDAVDAAIDTAIATAGTIVKGQRPTDWR